MYRPEAEIRIGAYRFKSVVAVSYTRSVDTLGSTAVITLPSRFRVRNSNEENYTEDAIKPGDAVNIFFYDELNGYHQEEFIGYVTRVMSKIPVEVHCEDAVWKLRQKTITKAFNDGCSLVELLNVVLEGVGIPIAGQVPDMHLDKYVIREANAAQVLQKLKSDYALTIYITDNGSLYVGLKFGDMAGDVSYDLDAGLVSNDLEYKRAEDRKIKVQYEYIAPDNERTVVEAGDSDGDMRSFKTSVVSDLAKLKEMAESEVAKLKYDGYDGTITSFMLPYATPGMAASLESARYPGRSGKYFISKTEMNLGTGGARRKVTLGVKL